MLAHLNQPSFAAASGETEILQLTIVQPKDRETVGYGAGGPSTETLPSDAMDHLLSLLNRDMCSAVVLTLPTDPAPNGGWPVWLPRLDAEERMRANSFRFAADRDSFIAAHGLLRQALSTFYGREKCPPDAWRFHVDPMGKPSLPAGLFSVSLSHTRGMVACALGRTDLGVDVEALGRQTPWPDCLTAEERRVLCLLPPSAQDERFLRHWTLKEALSKATGAGLGLGFNTIGVAVDPPRLIRGGNPDHWHFQQWTPAPGYVAAVAISCRDAGRPQVTVRQTTARAEWLS